MSTGSFELLQHLQPLFASCRTPVYLVGGAVRDALLGRPAYDLDFVVEEGAISLAFTVADTLRAAAYAMDRERDIGRVVLQPDTVLDFARFRGPDLKADLRARDFTINAMAVDSLALEASPDGAIKIAPQAIVDPCAGMADMQARRLDLTHARAIADDPIRALRAVRLCWQLNLEMSPRTADAARESAPQLLETSTERVRDEFLKLLRGPAPHHAIRQMADLGLLDIVLPEVAALRDVQQSAPHREAVLAHTFSVLARLLQCEAALTAEHAQDAIGKQLAALLQPYARDLLDHLQRPVDGMLDGRTLLRLGALFHDVGKAHTASVEEDGRIRFLGHDKEGASIAARRLRALRLSNEAVLHVRDIVAAHMRPLHLTNAATDGNGSTLTRRAVYRYFRATGSAGLDVALLSFADHLATYNSPGPAQQWRAMTSVVERLLSHYFEQYEEIVAPPPLIHGGELITALNLKPGPQIGRLLRLIEEAQAAGEIHTKEQAIDLARERLERED